MPNKTYALEWLIFARKNLETAHVLLKVDHYTDIIGVEIEQAVEKTLKALLAFGNQKIPRDHDLVKLSVLLEGQVKFSDDEWMLLRIITDYYKDERYPNPRYFIPSKEEIETALMFAENIFKEAERLIKG